MDALISHTTALRLLRDPALDFSSRARNLETTLAPNEPMDAYTARDLVRGSSALRRAGEPLETITSNPSGARRRPAYVSRVWGARIPSGSVFQVREGLWCSGPELTALELAGSLSELELTVLLCEMMGTYSVAPGYQGGMAQRAKPLTDPARLTVFLREVGGVKGSRALEKALKLAVAESASPMETKLVLRLCLPAAKKGFGLKLLSMNKPLEVERLGASTNDRGIRKPDILIAPWPGSDANPVAIEYDGEECHMTREGVLSDTVRGNELKAMGIGEYRVNREIYRNINYMEYLVEKVREEAGYPRRHRSAEDALRRKREHVELYKELARIGNVV